MGPKPPHRADLNSSPRVNTPPRTRGETQGEGLVLLLGHPHGAGGVDAAEQLRAEGLPVRGPHRKAAGVPPALVLHALLPLGHLQPRDLHTRRRSFSMSCREGWGAAVGALLVEGIASLGDMGCSEVAVQRWGGSKGPCARPAASGHLQPRDLHPSSLT